MSGQDDVRVKDARETLEKLVRRYDILVGAGRGIVIGQEHIEAINVLLEGETGDGG